MYISISSSSLAVLLEMLIVSTVLGILHAVRFAGKPNDSVSLEQREEHCIMHFYV